MAYFDSLTDACIWWLDNGYPNNSVTIKYLKSKIKHSFVTSSYVYGLRWFYIPKEEYRKFLGGGVNES